LMEASKISTTIGELKWSEMNDHIIVQDINGAEGAMREHEVSHDELKAKLIIHFNIALSKNEVVWPRRDGLVRNYTV